MQARHAAMTPLHPQGQRLTCWHHASGTAISRRADRGGPASDAATDPLSAGTRLRQAAFSAAVQARANIAEAGLRRRMRMAAKCASKPCPDAAARQVRGTMALPLSKEDRP